MKIGIITFHYNLNCGAILQAYALQTQLEKMGHEVEFIDYRPANIFTFKRFKALYLSKSVKIMWHKWMNAYQRIKFAYRDNFNVVIKQSKKRYKNINELREDTHHYDIFICGSDQIWNLENKTELPYAYLLDFGDKNTPRISFAASMNNAVVPEHLMEEFKTKLLHFKTISVREQKSFEVVSQLLKNTKATVSQVHDPTFLLCIEDYKPIFDAKGLENAPIVSYILSDLSSEQINAIKKFSASQNQKWVNMRNPTSCISIGRGIDKIVNPYQWLAYMNNAQYVICSSFHAVVFSLLFHKNFVVVLPKQHPKKKNANHRIRTILEPMGLIDRCISTFDDIMLANSLTKPINWEFVDSLIDSYQNIGLEFLKTNLKN